MNEDRLRRESDREVFEAIVSQLDDPEVVRLRRLFVVLGALCFSVAAVALGVVAAMGWPGVLAFSSTFVPGVIVCRRLVGRRSRR